MHRLRILRRAEFFALPEADQLLHLSHVRNDVQGLYTTDYGALYDDVEGEDSLTDRGTSSPYTPARSSRSRSGRGSKQIDAIELMASIAAHKHDPPTAKQIEMSRFFLSIPGMPENIHRDARETLERAGEVPP